MVFRHIMVGYLALDRSMIGGSLSESAQLYKYGQENNAAKPAAEAPSRDQGRA